MSDLIIFDIDGTLTTFQDEEEACFNQTVLRIFGVSEFNRDWGTYQNVTYSGFVREIMEINLGRTAYDEDFVNFENEFLQHFEPEVMSGDPAERRIPGANQMLTRLCQLENLGIAIATGNWRRVAALKLRSAGIDVERVPMATSSDAVTREEIMKTAETMAMDLNHGQPFDRVTYVGDGEWDAQASRNLNYQFIGITTKVPEAVFREYGAKAVFEDYSNLEKFIEAVIAED